MHVLLTGASGFIGACLHRALLERGHRVRCAGRRRPPHARDWWPADFASEGADGVPAWLPALQGVDVVVNAVGILRERGTQTFARLHDRAPRALFDACVQAGVPRVVQVSALGVEQQLTAYQRSKHAADCHLLALPLQGVVVQPSLVFGPGGRSAGLFLALASLPLLVVPDTGRATVQPVHVDDVVAALCAVLEAPSQRWRGRRVAVVGPQPCTLREMLQDLRSALGLAPASVWVVPAALAAAAARACDVWPASPLDSANWAMLRRGHAASPRDVEHLLGRPPRATRAFIVPDHAAAWRSHARMAWLAPLLRAALAAVWIVTGITSLAWFPHTESHALLARAGVPGPWQPAALWAAALLDIVLGVLTLRPGDRAAQRRRLWAVQALLILSYMAIIAWRLPEFWLHPYGPLLKNVPMLAILLLLWTLDGETRPAAAAAPGIGGPR